MNTMVGWWYILGMVFVLPFLAVRSAAKIRSGERLLPPRRTLHLNTIITLAALLGVAVFVGRVEWVWLFRPFNPDWRDPAAIIGFLAITVSLLLFKACGITGAHREKLERITMSDWRDPRQLLTYSLVALMAGIAEEIAYRGVLFELLLRHIGSWSIAVAIASAAFGVAHAVQGWRSALAVSGFAFLFHVIVLVTGDLYAAIIAHAVYDLIAGIVIAETGMRRRRAESHTTTADPQPPHSPPPPPPPEPPAAP